MAMQQTDLLTNAGAGVNGSAFPMAGARKCGLIASGTFSGTTVKLQASADGVTWVDVPGASFTVAGVLVLAADLLVPFVRGVTVGGTGSGLSLTMTQSDPLS